jgi:vacuolar-type H+-ATPase subunit E/Vma4
MATNSDDSAHVLCEEILAQARKQSEEIIARARRDAEVSLAGAAGEANKTGQEQRDRAATEAARRREMILATVSVEAGRMHAERVEALLESVHEEVRTRLNSREDLEYEKTVIALAAQAMRRMEGESFVVKVSEADSAVLGNGLAVKIAEHAGLPAKAVTVSYEPDFKGGGVVVEETGARRIWDNRFIKRLERMWPELRQKIAVKASFIPEAGSGERDA